MVKVVHKRLGEKYYKKKAVVKVGSLLLHILELSQVIEKLFNTLHYFYISGGERSIHWNRKNGR